MEATALTILRIFVYIICVVALGAAFIIHLKNRHSKSYLLIVGYFLMTIHVIEQLTDFKDNGLVIHWWFTCYFLLGVGEVIRFLKAEEIMERFIKRISHYNISKEHFRFDTFKRMPLSTTVVFEGRTVKKICDQGDTVTLLMHYDPGVSFNIQAEDYDSMFALQKGKFKLRIKDYEKILEETEEKCMVKRGVDRKSVV